MSAPNTPTPLSESTLVPSSIVVTPCYDRSTIKPGICHFGIGAFARSHLAYYMDVLLNDNEEAVEPVRHSVWGWLVQAIEDRMLASIPPFSILSCDNLHLNGSKTKECLLQYCELSDRYRNNEKLKSYIEKEIHCPQSMVDRITPAPREEHTEALARDYGIQDSFPVIAESWSQFVVEDLGLTNFPPLHLLCDPPYNVLMVKDVLPYELMKTRLLNASHLVIGYLGTLCGYQYVHEVMQDPVLHKLVKMFMDNEVTPTLPDVPGVDLEQYKSKLRKRFANHHCGDTTIRISRNGSSKLPIRSQLAEGGAGNVEVSALTTAAWLRFLNHYDDNGNESWPLDDQHAKSLSLDSVASQARSNAEVVVKAAETIIGTDLANNIDFVNKVQTALESSYEQGAKVTASKYASESVKTVQLSSDVSKLLAAASAALLRNVSGIDVEDKVVEDKSLKVTIDKTLEPGNDVSVFQSA